MLDLEKISQLRLGDNGIWFASKAAAVSFPEDGNVQRSSVEANSFWYTHRNRCLVSLTTSFGVNGALVDIGGGNGAVASALQGAGVPVVLLEPDQFGAEQAMRSGVQQVSCATFEGAGFHDTSLPAVGLFDVVEHIEDDSGFLRSVHRKLAAGGKIFITVPAYAWLWSDADVRAAHFRRYTLTQLNRLVADCGLRVLYSSYFFSVLTLPLLMMRALPYRLGIRREHHDWRRDHRHQRDASAALLLNLMSWEVMMVRKRWRIPCGTSCILVAEKS